MKPKITITLHLPEAALGKLDEMKELLLPFFTNAVVINEGEENEERGFIELGKCYHDETPTQPCEKIARWEVGRGKVI